MASTFDARMEIIRSSGGFSEAVLNQFATHLKESPDDDLFRASPIVYAQRSGLPEQEAIDLFLHATRAGLLEFSWGVLCPGCKGFINTGPALKALAERRHCTLCNIGVEADDDSVEITFTVSPSARRIRQHDGPKDFVKDSLRNYFSPSVQLAPRVVEKLLGQVQNVHWLQPGEARTVTARFAPGEVYAVTAPAHHAWARLHANESADREISIELTDGMAVPSEVPVGSGDVKLHLHNRSNRPMQLGVMTMMAEPPEATFLPYLTGKRMVATQSFRDLFRAESIPAAAGLALKNLTVLFTDLKSSTELYQRIGDLRAYELVNAHFEVLQKIIAARGGGMVKTIGDAIMASFAEPAPALEAAIAMNRDIQKVGGGELQLKIGIHAGPCIAVQLNERLDYFGQTVNIAARVQGIAEANEICVTDSIMSVPSSRQLVTAAKLSDELRPERLKGVDGEVMVHHLR